MQVHHKALGHDPGGMRDLSVVGKNEPLKRPSTESAVGQVFDSHKVFGVIVPITQDRNNIENKPWDEVYISEGR